jgi:hypothetical protein
MEEESRMSSGYKREFMAMRKKQLEESRKENNRKEIKKQH